MILTVHKGKNVFRPQLPILPHCSSSLRFYFKIGVEWWNKEGLTAPLIFGCKLPALGRFNYHRGGANWAIVYELGKVYVYPRYYEMIDKGTYIGHELSQYKEELQPEVWNYCVLDTDPLYWRFNGKMILYKGIRLAHGWRTPPFLGASGKDLNFPNDNSNAAVACRDLELSLRYV
jgi:hypothetical protein